MYVHNQAMYVQNQVLSPFFQDNLNDPWHVGNAQLIVREIYIQALAKISDIQAIILCGSYIS